MKKVAGPTWPFVLGPIVIVLGVALGFLLPVGRKCSGAFASNHMEAAGYDIATAMSGQGRTYLAEACQAAAPAQRGIYFAIIGFGLAIVILGVVLRSMNNPPAADVRLLAHAPSHTFLAADDRRQKAIAALEAWYQAQARTYGDSRELREACAQSFSQIGAQYEQELASFQQPSGATIQKQPPSFLEPEFDDLDEEPIKRPSKVRWIWVAVALVTVLLALWVIGQVSTRAEPLPIGQVDASVLNTDPQVAVKQVCTDYISEHGQKKFGIAKKFQIQFPSGVRELPNLGTGVAAGYTVDLVIEYDDAKGIWQRDEMYCTTDTKFENVRAYQPQKYH